MNYTVKKWEENWLTIKGHSKTNLISETACLISVVILMSLFKYVPGLHSSSYKTVLLNIARWADGWVNLLG